MKVRFDATFEDFVDVNKRSVGKNLSQYLMMGVITVVMAVAAGVLLYLIFQDWLISVIVATVSIAVGAATLASAQE